MKKVILGSVMTLTGIFAFVQMFNTVSVMLMSHISDEVFLSIIAGVFFTLALAAIALVGIVIGFKGAFEKPTEESKKNTELNNTN